MKKPQPSNLFLFSVVLGIMGLAMPSGGYAQSVVTLDGPNVQITTSGPNAEVCADQLALLNNSNFVGNWCGSLFTPAPPSSVPSMNEWGLIILSVILAGMALFVIRRRKPASF